ncbi:uncharacterized protein FSUBG_9515 [Fusarium subglutinans]|uniref:Uncharacterized protein n=1 Tax=Gibberella subglutinans TaxID=42677 RepID=A0A8H5UQW3_GIBSU|nr:uncharacterized protein FSUBG_9515 [Fusarium subglutinans]KAF5594259.1 hypothetical protein FSUBG_9515 [Fusarium subglutinans]
MDTAKAPSVIGSGQHLRREDMPPVSQVSEVKNPVAAPSSVPAEENTGNEAKKCLFKRIWSKAKGRLHSDAIIVGGEHYCPMGGCIPIRHECDHLAIPTLEEPQPRINRLLDDKWLSFRKQHFQACEARRYHTRSNIVKESPTNGDPEKVNAGRRSIGAPEIAIPPGQQEQSDLPTGPSPEMRENRSQTKTIKQKTAETSSAVGNTVDPNAITPVEAPTSWDLLEVAEQPPFKVPIPGATGSSAVGAASTNGTVGSKNRRNSTATNGTAPRLPVHMATSQQELGSIDKKTNVGPEGDVTEKVSQVVVTLPDPPKDDPKKSAKETEPTAEGKRKVAQPIAS